MLALASQAQAQSATSPEQLFSDFSRCDARFFETLNTASLPAGTLRVAKQGAVTAPVVMNPLQEGGRYQPFEQPLVVNGVRLVGYQNEAMVLQGVGKILFWGFVAEGSVKDVTARLKPLIADNARVAPDRGSFSRVDIRRVGDPIGQWRTEGLAGPGVATPFGYVERILSLEKGTTETRTKIFCSLQGTVTPPLLQVYRPDLNANLLD
ncbi:hypothetical protein ACI77F_19565 [Pseudomonas tritici]|uniref:hypothetical protein n=1 Tax=Pseudomonas TaxID=286 RepID=UPI0030D91F81